MRAVFFVVLMFSCRSGTSAISTVPEPLPREVSAVADARWVVGIRGTSAWQISKILPADFACLSTFFVDGAVTVVGFDLAMRVKGTIRSPAISDVKKCLSLVAPQVGGRITGNTVVIGERTIEIQEHAEQLSFSDRTFRSEPIDSAFGSALNVSPDKDVYLIHRGWPALQVGLFAASTKRHADNRLFFVSATGAGAEKFVSGVVHGFVSKATQKGVTGIDVSPISKKTTGEITVEVKVLEERLGALQYNDPVAKITENTVEYMKQMLILAVAFDGDCAKFAKSLLTLEPLATTVRTQIQDAIRDGYDANVLARKIDEGVKAYGPQFEKDMSAKGLSRAEMDDKSRQINAACAKDDSFQRAMDRVGLFKKEKQ